MASEAFFSIWTYKTDGAFSGISPMHAEDVGPAIEKHGHVVLDHESSWRNIVAKFSHDDAKFCEARPDRGGELGSQAAYYENEATVFGGRWMENPRLEAWLADGRVA